jgi:hypothetical protein
MLLYTMRINQRVRRTNITITQEELRDLDRVVAHLRQTGHGSANRSNTIGWLAQAFAQTLSPPTLSPIAAEAERMRLAQERGRLATVNPLPPERVVEPFDD